MDNINENPSLTNQLPPDPTDIPQNNNSQRVRMLILISLVIILLGAVGFLYLRLQKLSLDKSKITIEPTSNTMENKQINYVELTGLIYIGPRPYQLVYKIDTQKELGTYVLMSKSKDVNDVELTKEDNIDQGQVSWVATSPDNTKFILTSVLGDGTNTILIGVNYFKDGTLSQPIEPKKIVLPDKYSYTYHNILSWVDNERILIKRTDYDDKTGQVTKETYWIAPVSDITSMKEVQL